MNGEVIGPIMLLCQTCPIYQTYYDTVLLVDILMSIYMIVLTDHV
jgi:hypothetical protein